MKRPTVHKSTCLHVYMSTFYIQDTANVSLIDRMNNNMMHDLQY